MTDEEFDKFIKQMTDVSDILDLWWQRYFENNPEISLTEQAELLTEYSRSIRK